MHNYEEEIAAANDFVITHNYDAHLLGFIRDLQDNLHNMSHSERWSAIYDYLAEHYPGATGMIVTGLTYWVEQ